MWECFHCLTRAVIWDSDYTFEELGYAGDGIVHVLHCENCGATIEYDIPSVQDAEDAKRELVD